MSRDARVELAWADGSGACEDGKYAFRLGIKELRTLQEKCDAGPLQILRRLQTERWMIDDVREPIRLGLVGAGMPPSDALKLVVEHVDKRPIAENVLIAHAVVMVALYGAPDDSVSDVEKKATGATTETDLSASPPSTGSVLQ